MFYTTCQNNSGGVFHHSKEKGISRYVIVEACNTVEANHYLEEIGCYFHGVSRGMDCQCCGDRWHKAYEDDGKNTPQVWGDDLVEAHVEDTTQDNELPSVCVHYKDRTFKWFKQE